VSAAGLRASARATAGSSTRALAALPWALVGLQLACSADTKTAELPEVAGAALLLTATEPTQRTALRRGARVPALLELTLAAVDNPSQQAFSIAAELVWSPAVDAVHEVELVEALGQVTPFPATVAQRLLLDVPAAASEFFRRSSGELALDLRLVPIEASRPLLEPLRVQLNALRWQ
jgi:hypothetical protein